MESVANAGLGSTVGAFTMTAVLTVLLAREVEEVQQGDGCSYQRERGNVPPGSGTYQDLQNKTELQFTH